MRAAGPYVDSHAHLQAGAFDADAAVVLQLARAGGVVRLLAPGWDVESSRASVRLAGQLGTDASAGIHPHVADDVDDAGWQAVASVAAHASVVAIGETGLDYDRAFSSRDGQLRNLRRHLALGRDLGKPVILHCRSARGERDAHDDLLRELRAAGAGSSAWPVHAGRAAALLHSFSGPVDYAQAAIEMGLVISFSGLVFRRGEESSAEVAGLVPPELLLTETDSPYLAPPGAPRRRNEPRYVHITAQWLAERRSQDGARLGEQLVANYDRLFGRNLGR